VGRAMAGGLSVHGSVREADNEPKSEFHEVKDVTTACNKKNLHEGIVQRDPSVEKIKVACDEDRDVESLRLE
jgi:hypothetical protein